MNNGKSTIAGRILAQNSKLFETLKKTKKEKTTIIECAITFLFYQKKYYIINVIVHRRYIPKSFWKIIWEDIAMLVVSAKTQLDAAFSKGQLMYSYARDIIVAVIRMDLMRWNKRSFEFLKRSSKIWKALFFIPYSREQGQNVSGL